MVPGLRLARVRRDVRRAFSEYPARPLPPPPLYFPRPPTRKFKRTCNEDAHVISRRAWDLYRRRKIPFLFSVAGFSFLCVCQPPRPLFDVRVALRV